MTEYIEQFGRALVFLGHPVLGSALGSYVAVAGVHVAEEMASLEEAVQIRLAESPVSQERVGSHLLYVAWPELWRQSEPIPPLMDEENLREELLHALDAALVHPAVVSRLSQTPAPLRGELRHRPEALLEMTRPLNEAGPIGQYESESHLPLLFERQGQFLLGICRRGLLDSFDLQFEPMFREPSPWNDGTK